MLFCMNNIKDCISRLTTLSELRNGSKEELLNDYKAKSYMVIYDLLLCVNEARMVTEDYALSGKCRNITRTLNNIEMCESIEEFKRHTEDILHLFDDMEYDIYGIANRDINYYNEISKQEIRHSIESYDFEKAVKKIRLRNEREIKTFTPDCFDGHNGQLLNAIGDGVLTYGNERGTRLSCAKEVMTKVIKGPLNGSRISNEVFDVVNVVPVVPYEMPPKDKFFVEKRPEKKYITDMYKYLRKDGVMIITIPYYRMYKDICTSLAKQLKNIQIYREGSYFDSIGMVTIMGQKAPVKELNKRMDEYLKLRRCYDYESIPYIDDLDFSYLLPADVKEIDFFKGSVLDTDEIEEILSGSHLTNTVIDNQVEKKFGEEIINPLLPFNIGQIGLVLTSGCLDGIVDEGDGKHLIKGRVCKKTYSSEDTVDNVSVKTETINNKVEINVLLPNGDYKVLA